MRVALIQLDLASDAGRPTPLGPAEEEVRDAVRSGAEFVILPELWRTGPFELETTVDLAEPLTGPTVTAMANLARESGVWLHAGSVLTSTPALHNTALLFDPTGALVATYRKRHLFGFDIGEAALIDSGDEVVVVDTPLGRTGLATCYDLRFPEHFRALLDAGAETVLLTSGWPERRISHWDLLTTARAVENQMNLIACNGSGRSGDVIVGGRSVIHDPWGRTLLQLGDEPGTGMADVDPEAPSRTRAEFPVLRDRR